MSTASRFPIGECTECPMDREAAHTQYPAKKGGAAVAAEFSFSLRRLDLADTGKAI